MAKRQTKKEKILDLYPDYEFLFMTGREYDTAIVGVLESFGQEPRVCYDKEKILQILMKDGLTYEEAYEHFDYNIIGGYHGELTPAFIETV